MKSLVGYVVAVFFTAMLQCEVVSGNFQLEVEVVRFHDPINSCGIIVILCDPYIDEMCLDPKAEEEEEGQECSLAVSTADLDLEDFPRTQNIAVMAQPWPVDFRLLIKVMDNDLLDPDDHIEDVVVLESLNTSSEFSEEKGYRNTPDGRITLTLMFRVQCTGGYEGPHCDCLPHNDTTNGHYTCQEDGGISCLPGYTNTSNFCKERGCDVLQPPENGEVFYSSTDIGSMATYVCLYGYILTGVPRRQCQDNRSWSDSAPQCEPSVCSDLRVGPNVKVAKTNENFVFSVATHTCPVGYRLFGNERRECQPSGIWSGNIPACFPVLPYPPSTTSFIYESTTSGSSSFSSSSSSSTSPSASSSSLSSFSSSSSSFPTSTAPPTITPNSPTAITAVVVAGLLGLCTVVVVVVVVIVCIALKKRRLSKDSTKAPNKGGTSIKHLISSGSRTRTAIQLAPNKAYSANLPSSGDQPLKEDASSSSALHNKDDLYTNPAYSIHDALHQPQTEHVSSSLQGNTDEVDTIQLSPNPVYGIHNGGSKSACSLQHSPRPESTSGRQGNQITSQNVDTIPLQPNPLYDVCGKNSNVQDQLPNSASVSQENNNSTASHSAIQLQLNPVYSIRHSNDGSNTGRPGPEVTGSQPALSPQSGQEPRETGVYSYAYYSIPQQ